MSRAFWIAGGTIYLMLAIFHESFIGGQLIFGTVSTVLQVGLDAAILYYTLKVARKRGRRSWEARLLVPAFLFLFIGDIVYGLCVNVMGMTLLRGTLTETAYNLIYFVTLATVAAYFIIITRNVGRYLNAVRLAVLMVATAMMISFFSGKLFSPEIGLLSSFIHLGCLTAKAIILSHALIGSVLFSSQFRRWFSCGFLIILSYSLLLEYLEVENLVQPALSGEIFWTLGLYVILLSLRKAARAPVGEDRWDDSSLVAKITFISLMLAVIVGLSWVILDQMWQTHFHQLPHFGLYAAWFILVMVAAGIVAEYFKTFVIAPMEKLSEYLQCGKVSEQEVTFLGKTREFHELSRHIFLSFKALSEEKAKNERLSTLAAHMSHDIRSPLTALRMLTSRTDGMSEDGRRMILQVTARINNIAEHLLSAQKNTDDEPQDDICLVYEVAETIIAEKRVLLPGSSLYIELNVDDSDYMSWINMPSEAFGRILSNLMNNSIEAFESDRSITNPRVSVAISRFDHSTLRISVQDNAGGIPNAVIKALAAGEKLTTKKTGSGIGLTQARDWLARDGGSLQLYSQVGFGSVVNVFVRLAKRPTWAVSELEIDKTLPVLILDDDDSIHSVWRRRLDGVVEVISCNDIQKANEVARSLPAGATLLVDFLLRSSTNDGLDFIASLPKKFSVCLVTSRFEDPEIQKKAAELNCKILPKFLVPFVPIRVSTPHVSRAQKTIN